MNRTKLMLTTAAAAAGMFLQFSAIAAGPVKVEPAVIKVATDRQDALYKCGEKVVFTGVVTQNDKLLTAGRAAVRLSNDGMKTVSSQEIDLAQNNPFKVEATMAVPGFLQCEARLDKDKGYAAAGFEPERIQPAANLPDDFKKFWDDGIRELDKIPPDVKLEPLPKFSTPQFDCFKISFTNIDNTRIYGFLSVPMDRKGLFPALVFVTGAGPGFCVPDTGWVRRGVIVLRMNVHQYDPPTDKAELKIVFDKVNEPLYCYQGVPDRDKYYFKKSILGINRSINWLAERTDVDKEHFAMFGSSQGGAFALIMAGLNKNIKAAAANVPGLCDHAGYKLDRSPGWPRLVTGNDPAKLKMSGYFDTVNFSAGITCPVIVGVGFIDTVCSPSSVFAAYNTIQSPKMILIEPALGHTDPKRFDDFQTEWLKGRLGLAQEIPPLKTVSGK